MDISSINGISTNQIGSILDNSSMKKTEESNSFSDVLVAETKTSVALQYTVAVRDKIIDAYKQLMQMSI